MKLRSFLLASVFFVLCISVVVAQTRVVEHTVVKGETLYRLSKNYGVTVEQIVAQNPGLTAETLQEGLLIKIPSTGTAPSAMSQKEYSRYATHKVQKEETIWGIARMYGISVDSLMESNPQMKEANFKLKKGLVLRIPQIVPAQKQQSKSLAQNSVSAAILLPLTATGIEGERSVEFYRGFLMAADKVRENGSNINVYTYNELSSSTNLTDILSKVKNNRVQFLIGPVYPSHFDEVSSFCRSNGIRMIVPFSSKAKQVNVNRYVYLLNTPAEYEKILAADLFLKTFKGKSVLFLHTNKADQPDFTQYLRQRLLVQGATVVDANEDATIAQLKTALNNKRHIIVVPDASDVSALQNVFSKLKEVRQAMPKTELSLIGYSSWLNQSDRYEGELFLNDTYIFTPSYYEPSFADVRQFNADYQAWFKKQPLDVIPRMGLLGYDTGLQMLQGILKYGEKYNVQGTEKGLLQSNLRFGRTEEDGGYINQSMFLIHYKPNRTIDKITAK